MKIDKVFEYNKYYSRVVYNPNEDIVNRNQQLINESEINKILSIFPQFYKLKYTTYSIGGDIKYPLGKDEKYKKWREIKVYIDDDEWYHLYIIDYRKDISPYIIDATHPAGGEHYYRKIKDYNREWYKCDQWDGLIQCIKDKVIV